MFEAPRCAWCEAWTKEIGPIYPKTEEAARAPLRRVDLTQKPLPADIKTKEPVRMTPTFVLVDDGGEEIGRITGYAGDEMFWWQLDNLMEALED
ncbi:Regulatory protein SoxS [Caenispirillum salinarum AK4]|uniref:Regulatory protein SoxS n=1 Tax=Caenispirillum salinarum AK4 TaxID=1238182 RepID=K9H964_9PROT|nr:thioredoxin family protein [Caenispirillum salinarum]EKV27118.1 Regulatory protein SoxS [Caenispirillum salinarum AK4]